MAPTEQVRPVSGLNTSAELRYDDDDDFPPTIKMPEIFLIMGKSNLNIYFTSLVKIFWTENQKLSLGLS